MLNENLQAARRKGAALQQARRAASDTQAVATRFANTNPNAKPKSAKLSMVLRIGVYRSGEDKAAHEVSIKTLQSSSNLTRCDSLNGSATLMGALGFMKVPQPPFERLL